jgi:hypothetical protein
VNVCIDYITCSAAGYFLGAASALFVAPLTITTMQMRQLSHMHSTAVRWGTTLGSIAATFAGFQTTSFAVYDGNSERWPSIVGSMAIGAFHSRAGQYLFAKSATPALFPCACCLTWEGLTLNSLPYRRAARNALRCTHVWRTRSVVLDIVEGRCLLRHTPLQAKSRCIQYAQPNSVH